CRGPRRAGALQETHALLEHGDGGIGVAAIDEAALALETLLGFFGGLVDVALGKKQRLGGLAEARAQAAAMHEARFEAPIFLLLRICRLVAHARTPWARRLPGNKKTGQTWLPLKAGRLLVGRRARPFSDFFSVAASRPAKSPRDCRK